MEFSVIFLLSSIVTARLLEKKKMRMASVAYSVMFIIMMFVLLFTVDVGFVRQTMLNIFGRACYYGVYNALTGAINSSGYGAYIVGAIILTIAVQVSVTVLTPVRAIVRYFIQKKTVLHKFKKAYERLVYPVHSLYISGKINLLFCRMLN